MTARGTLVSLAPSQPLLSYLLGLNLCSPRGSHCYLHLKPEKIRSREVKRGQRASSPFLFKQRPRLSEAWDSSVSSGWHLGGIRFGITVSNLKLWGWDSSIILWLRAQALKVSPTDDSLIVSGGSIFATEGSTVASWTHWLTLAPSLPVDAVCCVPSQLESGPLNDRTCV